MTSETAENTVLQHQGFTIKDNIIEGIDEPYLGSRYIGEVIFDTLNEAPDHVAQIKAETGDETTFAEMKDRSVRCALWMEKQGIRHDDVVTICTYNRMDMYIPIFATFYVEAVYNSLAHDMTLYSARYFMKLLKPKLIFACKEAVDVLTEASKLENINIQIVSFDNDTDHESLQKIMEIPSEKEVSEYIPRKMKDPKELSGIFLSSGSTGFSKGVMLSGESLVINLQLLSFVNKSDVYLLYTPLCWANYFMVLLNKIFKKETRIMHSNDDMEEMCKVIEKYKVQSIYLQRERLLEFSKTDVIEKYDLRSLREITYGGSKANKNIAETIEKRIPNVMTVQIYGMTELFRAATMQTRSRSCHNTVGTITKNLKLKIVDQTTGEVLGPNKQGELYCKHANIMLGYYKNPEETKQIIDSDGWLHSGDLFYYNENGEFFFIDRLKELMKYRSHQVSPGEIEEVLLIHPAVKDAAVVPIPHEVDGEHPMAFVQITPGEKVTEEELVELSAILGEGKKLRGGVKFLDEMPRLPNKKVNRSELKCIAKTYAEEYDN